MSNQLTLQVPEEFQELLLRRDFSAISTTLEILAEENTTSAPLIIWTIASQEFSNETLQLLSYELVRTFSGPVAEASRLWLILQRQNDQHTLINTLSGLEAAVMEERGLPDYQLSVLPDFLLHCLEHPAQTVRISVLDFLRGYSLVLGWPRRFGRTASRRLAMALKRQLSEVVVEEEVDELEAVSTGLNSDVIPLRPSIRLEEVNALVKDLEKITNADALASVVRVCRLRDDAKRQAQQDDRPVLTVRVLAGATKAFMESIREVVKLCLFENVDPTSNVWVAAPAASQASHCRARPATTKDTFERLQLARAIADQDAGAEDLAQLPARQAGALARMLTEASEAGAEAEFMLTSPEIGDPQTVLPFRQIAESAGNWRDATRQAELRAIQRPEVYSDEVPQANTVRQVIQAVEAILRVGVVSVDDIDNISTGRQVNYYISAARSLNLLDDDNEPTPLGQALQGKPLAEQMEIAAVAFRESMVGRAWRAWAGAQNIADVSPNTAERFLQDRAIGISGSTIPRRASTLKKWQAELLEFYKR